MPGGGPVDPEKLKALRRRPELRQMRLGIRVKRRRNVELYMRQAPTEPIDVPWADEFFEDVEAAFSEPQIVLLVGPETKALLGRLRSAPRRKKWFERVRRDEIYPIEDPSLVDEGWYWDTRSRRPVVVEDDGSWWRETPYPEGAFTVGELARLEALMWQDADRIAQHADDLSDAARHAGVAWVEGADHLQLRLTVIKIQPESSEEARELKRSVLEIMLRDET